MKQETTLVFEIERETPGALRYKETLINGDVSTPDNYVVGTLYIRKRALNGGVYPGTLTVTISR